MLHGQSQEQPNFDQKFVMTSQSFDMDKNLSMNMSLFASDRYAEGQIERHNLPSERSSNNPLQVSTNIIAGLKDSITISDARLQDVFMIGKSNSHSMNFDNSK